VEEGFVEYDISLPLLEDYEVVEYSAELGGQEEQFPGELRPSPQLLSALRP
jgi:hypothetical protein